MHNRNFPKKANITKIPFDRSTYFSTSVHSKGPDEPESFVTDTLAILQQTHEFA